MSYIKDLEIIYETMGPQRQAMNQPAAPQVGQRIPKGKDIIPPPPGKPPGQVVVKKQNTAVITKPPLPSMLMGATVRQVLSHAKNVDIDLTEKLKDILAALSRKTTWPTVYFNEK